MTRFVRLSDGCYVNPKDVQEIKVNWDAGSLTVRMRDGVGHHVAQDYGASLGSTLDRVKKELEAVDEPSRAA